jgi:hypothetical protein
MTDEKMTKKEKRAFRLLVWDKTHTLLSAALGLVAALAWNDAIQSLFRLIFGEAASLYAKFFYAVAVTALSVFLVARLTHLTSKLNGDCDDDKKE